MIAGRGGDGIVRLKWLFAFNAIAAAIYAVPAILVPGLLFSVYGMAPSTAGGQFVMQLFGSTLAGEAIIAWGLRDIGPGPTRRVATLAFFVEAVIGLAASLIAQLNGVMNVPGWGVVALAAIFTLGYGYYRFVRPDAP